jgi:hypothetical protein
VRIDAEKGGTPAGAVTRLAGCKTAWWVILFRQAMSQDAGSLEQLGIQFRRGELASSTASDYEQCSLGWQKPTQFEPETFARLPFDAIADNGIADPARDSDPEA